MRLVVPMLAAVCAGLAVGAEAAGAATWTCTAKNLVYAAYDGGPKAYVHLKPFQTGGHYPVVKSKDGTVATGRTANGTAFTCKRS